MIGTQTPFRVSFAGGGSDLPAFYRREPGCVLSTSINKYMYILVHPYFEQKFLIKYSKTELVDRVQEIQHPIVREVLRRFDVSSLDINSIADIPAGTGLGSSSAFAVGLLHAIYALQFSYPSKAQLAREACEIEIEKLGEPIGKQDQYAAAFGGLNFITFNPDETVDVEPIRLPSDKALQLQSNLMMFYVGKQRKAGDILKHQGDQIAGDDRRFEQVRAMTRLARRLRESLHQQNLHDFGQILNEGWQLKRQLSQKISSDEIDRYYDTAIRNGALGGKLLGAGGSGFMLFYCEQQNQDQLRQAMGLRQVEFRFDFGGTKVFYVGDSAMR